MSVRDRQVFESTAQQCVECGRCAQVCSHLGSLGDLLPGGIARAMLDGNRDQRVTDFTVRCSICGLCRGVCESEVDFPTTVLAARNELVEDGTIDAEEYRYLWIDHDWNGITAFRDTYQIEQECEGLPRTECTVLFFPGCALANGGPGLVRAAMDWLGRDGKQVGLSLLCCGSPLEQMGLEERAKRYEQKLVSTLSESRARQIVTACPHCHLRLQEALAKRDTEVVSLFQLMSEAGIRVPVHGEGKVTVHDSCASRQGDLGKHVRSLFAEHDLVEMKHHGRSALCCGSGGAVSQIDPQICRERARERLREFEESRADTCITYCMSCSDRLACESGGKGIRHALELIFDQPLDLASYHRMIKATWEGEWGEYNRQRVESSKELETLE